MTRMAADDHSVLFATCDSRMLRFLRARLAPRQRLHVEESGRFASRWIDFHEHARPLMLGRGPKANASQHFADEHREPEELAARFARDAVGRLDEVSREARGGQIPVFAEGRFLGHLRAAAAAARSQVVLLHGNLAPLDAGELAVHPLVVELMRESAASERGPLRGPSEAELRSSGGDGGVNR